jgi:hypothetical protein
MRAIREAQERRAEAEAKDAADEETLRHIRTRFFESFVPPYSRQGVREAIEARDKETHG